jgi:uncharacterized protein (DUF302 family)
MFKAGIFFSVAAAAMAMGSGPASSTPSGPSDLLAIQSTSDVAGTEARARAALTTLGVPVFATFDHAANAKAAGLSLRPTVVLVFGNPKVGTKLMLDQQAIALDLPLRLAIWEDEQGATWVGYHDVKALSAAYGVKDAETVSKLASFMSHLAHESAGTSDH